AGANVQAETGMEVLINPNINWGDSEKAQSQEYTILGLPTNGTFAEYVCVAADRVHPKPAHLTFEQAAALPLAGLTAYRALFTRAQLQPAEKVLITGAGGGVALFAIQFAIAAGAEVYVTSGSDEKIARAKEMGARGGINYRQDDWFKQLKKEAGLFDVIIDSAGGDQFAHLVDLAAPGGRIAFYGGTLGKINNLIPGRIFWKQLSILGSTMGSDADFKNMLAFVAKHKLVPEVDSVFPLSETEQAFRKMDAGKQFGKIVIKIS
ncbi:MAG: zinc-binding dehydrogenase, partial [Hymenobacteraceae bacterium]|nr:zinc-binding dehydrogenase [Hymenobacteraceae bacterium]MDX5395588.1 zinc-binding dehydrogenase [Hymenobacteraceae bacterium]MDX5511640.1 zinc-binding dehydrogenase [Hymenobacteraceae bacterium]